MTPAPRLPDFKRNAVRPIECLKQGWDLIKDQYWLFLGMTIVSVLIGNAVPLGIMAGPMMCGLYLCLLKRQAGEPVEFATLFKGFDFFVDGLIAGVVHAVPMAAIISCFYVFMFAGQIAMALSGDRGEPNPAVALSFLAVICIGLPVMFILLILLAIIFVFAYPLIVDRRLSGLNAVKHSFSAAMANFWPLFGLLLLNGLLGFAGVLVCGVGLWFVMPVTISALAIAYTQVFGLARQDGNYPPPPPTF
jgi:hypothetical protein